MHPNLGDTFTESRAAEDVEEERYIFCAVDIVVGSVARWDGCVLGVLFLHVARLYTRREGLVVCVIGEVGGYNIGRVL